MGIVASSLNTNDCSQVLYNTCSKLNRNPCRSTLQTCGVCFEGYIGESGDHNNQCYPPDLVASFVATASRERGNGGRNGVVTGLSWGRSLLEGTPCNDDKECDIWEICQDRTCKRSQKTCIQSCNQQGYCKYISFSGKVDLTADYICYTDNESCSAVCVCNEGWYGSTCAYSHDQISQRATVKMKLLDSLKKMVFKIYLFIHLIKIVFGYVIYQYI